MEKRNSPLFGNNSQSNIPTDHPSPTSSESTQDEDTRTNSSSSAYSSTLHEGNHSSSKPSKLNKSTLLAHSDKSASKSSGNSSSKKVMRTEEEKKEIQKQRNRISAQNHRERQKKTFQKLQKKSQEDGKRLKQLEDENKALRNQISYLSHQIDSERMRTSQLTSIISQNNPSLLELAPSSSLPVSTRVDCPPDFTIDPFNIWLTKPNIPQFDGILNPYDTSSSFYNDLSAFSQYTCEFQQPPAQPKHSPYPNYIYPYYNKSQLQKKPVTLFSWIAALLLGLLIFQCFILPSNWISPNPTFSNPLYNPSFESDLQQLFNTNNNLVQEKHEFGFNIPSSPDLLREEFRSPVNYDETETEYGDSNSEADNIFKEILNFSNDSRDTNSESISFDIIHLEPFVENTSGSDSYFWIDQGFNSQDNLDNDEYSVTLDDNFDPLTHDYEPNFIYYWMDHHEFNPRDNRNQYTFPKFLPKYISNDFIDAQESSMFFSLFNSKRIPIFEWPLLQYFSCFVTLSYLLSIFTPPYCKFVTK